MHIRQLDETNALLYAAQNYSNPQCFDTLEFYEDLSRFKYLKRLFKRYQDTGDLRERLIMNHLVVLYNLFGVEATTRLLFLKLDGFYPALKPFLELLGCMPDVVHKIGITGVDIHNEHIIADDHVVKILQKI